MRNKDEANPGLLSCVFSFFSSNKFTGKTVDFSKIRTRAVGVEGEHADHWTPTKAQNV